MAGLNIRTIQRIERGQKAGLESMKSLAAVFEVNFNDLTQETEMNNPATITSEEQMALEYVREVKGFYLHLLSYVVTIVFLYFINKMSSPQYMWVGWVIFGWGIGVLSHAFSVFMESDIFGPAWEKRQVEKRLGRKL